MSAVGLRGLIMRLDKRVEALLPQRIRAVWNHPAGPKTIFFWAPSFKWALVIAGIADVVRPPERLSVYQSSALAATGVIWSRYSFVIIPVNYNLFSVNIFVAATGFFQLSRIYMYRKSLKELPPAEEAETAETGKTPAA
ncbi:mitochondrial pyruvate carrier 2-like [Branchiostoma floridae x Branchiostoma japonicum]|uniref:Mitochondrial pyruvate carrier n=1 Tax=Branchiostoma floridae TaxID=7739 RepID=C3ZJX8_BRAFL|eukprot:XP_002591134.1 hypothetical protein BRAFLDRAFT_131136 [Branchiostoma floridae]